MKSPTAKNLLKAACALTLLGGLGAAHADGGWTSQTLTICADPGNMPISSQQSPQGFEQKIAPLIAAAMGVRLQWQWWPTLGHGMMRKTIGSGICDAWMDMPPGTEGAETTTPLYRSTYVLVTASKRHLKFKNFDDPALHALHRIGVYETSSIREALAEHGIFGSTVIHYVSYNTVNDPTQLPSHDVQEVLDGKLDAAAIWGPFAGYYKAVLHEPIDIQPTNLWSDNVPLQAEMSFAVAKGNDTLKAELEKAMRAKKDQIKQVLVDYGVPLVQCDQCVISGDLPAHQPYSGKFKPVQASTQASGAAAGVAELKGWLAAGADPNQELDDAIVADDLSRVRYLLAHGADANARNGDGYTALGNATRFGYNDIATYLVEHGADVNRTDLSSWTPLHYAVWANDAAMVRVLTAHGAKVNVVDSKGETPLDVAAEYGKFAPAAALIDAGADVNRHIGTGGYTPLMLATLAGSRDIVELLLQHGAKVDDPNSGGVTALMIAVAHQDPELVKLLLERGADPKRRTADGRTALSIAEHSGNPTLVHILKTTSAKQGMRAASAVRPG